MSPIHKFETQESPEQVVALDQLLYRTHSLLGLIDEFGEHELLTDEQQELLDEMYMRANKLDNIQYERLQNAKDGNGIPEEEDVQAHVDLRDSDYTG